MADFYKLINYSDVWHTEDGWEVNNLHEVEDVQIILHSGTSNEVFVQLQRVGYLLPNVTQRDIEVWNDYDMIEFYNAENGEPLGRLERIQEI